MSIDAERQLDIARTFAETWADLLTSLPDDYTCHLNCAEADTAAELLRAFGYEETAASLIRAHAEHDEPGETHHDHR
jgi:hypothetical protein